MNLGASKDWIQQLYVREFGPKLQPNEFYYNKRRGSCCGSRCLHCPYDPKWEKGGKTIKESRLRS